MCIHRRSIILSGLWIQRFWILIAFVVRAVAFCSQTKMNTTEKSQPTMKIEDVQQTILVNKLYIVEEIGVYLIVLMAHSNCTLMWLVISTFLFILRSWRRTSHVSEMCEKPEFIVHFSASARYMYIYIFGAIDDAFHSMLCSTGATHRHQPRCECDDRFDWK